MSSSMIYLPFQPKTPPAHDTPDDNVSYNEKLPLMLRIREQKKIASFSRSSVPYIVLLVVFSITALILATKYLLPEKHVIPLNFSDFSSLPRPSQTSSHSNEYLNRYTNNEHSFQYNFRLPSDKVHASTLPIEKNKLSNAVEPLDLHHHPKNYKIGSYIIYNASIHTADPKRLIASAFAVTAGRFIKVGDDDSIINRFPEFPRFNASKRTIIPGLIDSHAHLIALGSQEAGLDLTGVTSLSETLDKCRNYVKERNISTKQWLQGNGWDESLWDGHKFPSRYDLDKYFPDQPVCLERVDGHSIWANSKAIEIAEKENGPFPKEVTGGRIYRDAKGEPTGIFSDAASDLIYSVVSGSSGNDVSSQEAMEIAVNDAKRHGLTGVHDASFPAQNIKLVKKLIEHHKFDIRLYAMLGSWDDYSLKEYCPYESVSRSNAPYGTGWGRPRHGQLYGYGNGKLTVRAVKVFMDGALGSRGAALMAPYSDDNSTSGTLTHTFEALKDIVEHWAGCGFQVCTHAIGDRANRLVLDAYQQILAGEADPASRRFRIEHAQILTRDDIPRFHELGILPSMQPTHATSDMTFAEDRLGDRVQYGYAWKSLLKTSDSLVIPFGSDFPFAGFINPFWGIHAAVTRQNAKGEPKGGWYSGECLSREEALRGFTLSAAYASFQENEIGSITAGKRADFVIVQGGEDILADNTDPLLIRNAKVLTTVLDGVPTYLFTLDTESQENKSNDTTDLDLASQLRGLL